MKNAEKTKIVNLKGEEVYLEDLDLYELYAIAGSSINDDDLIEKIYIIKSKMASNPETSIKDLERLSNDEDWTIRYYVTQNPSATSNLLTKLSYEKEKEIRYKTVLNKNVSDLTVLRLLRDPENSVRCAAFDVAKERNLDFNYERVGEHQIKLI